MSKTGKSRLSRLLPKFLRGGDKKTDGGIDSKSPYCVIHFLDDSDHQMQFKGSWKGGALQEKVCELLNLHEKDYFGLRFIDSSGQTHWLDGNKSLSSQFKGCQTPYKLYFGVKFYAADPCKLREEITRYLFFLQVKQDILQGRLPVTFDEASELCAYSVQSELGDYDPRQHTNGYVSEFCFVPNQTEELERRVAALHRRMGGMVPLMAEFRYLDKVKWLDMYGVDLHPVLGEGNVEYFLGLTPTGIVVYKNKNKVGNYFWPRINKVTFKGKIFIVKVKDKNNEEHVYAFELSRKTACKHLWKCCVEHHAFFRLNQTQERSSRENRVLRSVSNHRSGRSERQALSDNLARNPTNVNRLPSRRQPRRVSSDSRINADRDYDSQYDQDTGMVTMMMKPEPVRAPRHRSLPELQGHESPRSTKSAPWETNYDYGLYTHGKESPVSEQNNKAREQRSRAVAGSDSESGISQRRKYFPNRRGSDNDSDVSVTRRRRREIDSDSASDVSSRHPANQGQNGRSKSAFPVLYPFHDKENRPNGSVPSLHSAPAGEAKQRRRRRRSKSPSKRPPEELKQHFEYELKSTDGLSADELKEIPFINVETKASVFKLKYSPKLRQKVKAAKQKSLGELDQNRNQMMKKQNSGFLDEDKEPAMSVRSQPLPSKGYGDRDSEGHSQSRVGHRRVSHGQPLSYHEPDSQKPHTDIKTAPHHASVHSELSHSLAQHANSDAKAYAVKPRTDPQTQHSNIPSELLYQPSHTSQGGMQPQEQYAISSSGRPYAVSESSKVTWVNPVDSLGVTNNYVRLSDRVGMPEGYMMLSDVRSPKGSSAAPQYSRSPNKNLAAPHQSSVSPQKHFNSRSSDTESTRPHHVASLASSYHSHRLPHRDTVSHSHLHSQGGAYDSDINPSAPRTRDRPADRGETQRGDTNRYSHRHSRGETEDYEYSDAGRGKADSERLHPKSVAGDTWREGSSSGQRGDGQMGSQRQYREDSSSQQQQSDSYLSPPKSSQGIPSQISSPPTYGGRRQGNVSFSSLSSPPPTYLHYQRHQQLRAQSSAPASSYATHSSYNYTSSYPSSSHYDQGQRPRSYVPDERSRSAQNPYDDYRLRDKPDRSGTYGTEDGQQGRYQGEGPDRSRTSLRDVRPRSTYQVEPGPQQQQQQQYDYQQHSGYQHGPSNQNSPHQYRHPSPQPQNQGMQSRTQGTPPRSQGTPPRHQAPSHYQGTPPRYQGTPSRQSVSGSTPPRQNVDPRYSQGLVHAREQSEGSSSQASVRGAGNLNPSTRLSVGPYGSGHSSHRGVGNSLTPEQARQLLKSSNYNPDLCTEL